MLAVLDANVLVSAAISAGPPHRVVQRWLEHGEFDVVACPLLIAEIKSVLLERPRMRRWIAADSARRFLSTLGHTAVMMPDPTNFPSVTRDVKDDYLIALAQAAGADVIVSGDQDLLTWATQDPPVVTPQQFEATLARLPRLEDYS